MLIYNAYIDGTLYKLGCMLKKLLFTFSTKKLKMFYAFWLFIYMTMAF